MNTVKKRKKESVNLAEWKLCRTFAAQLRINDRLNDSECVNNMYSPTRSH